METALIRQDHQLPTITCKLSQEEEYFYRLDKNYTIKQYADLKLKDVNSEYKGEELARYHIGNALQKMYELIGVPRENWPEGETARRIAKYIQRTFPFIAPIEIIDSVEFALQEKFPIKRKDGSTMLDHYRQVNLKFISEFLQAYVKWRYEKKAKLIEKIGDGKAPPYHIIVDMLIKDDQVVKQAIKEAFELYKKAEPENKKDHLLFIRDIWFDFMVDTGIIKYDSVELNQKYKTIRESNHKISSADAKHQVRMFAMAQAFDKLIDVENPFEIFNHTTYVSWNVLKLYHSGKKVLGW